MIEEATFQPQPGDIVLAGTRQIQLKLTEPLGSL